MIYILVVWNYGRKGYTTTTTLAVNIIRATLSCSTPFDVHI